MKRLLSILSILGALSCVVVFPMLQVGCEEAEGLDGLTVSPSSVTLTTNLQVTTFSVTGITNQTLALPLMWSVSDAALGAITASSGFDAIYQRTSVSGVNTITVRDQYENEGYASVTSGASSDTITLAADSTSISVGGSSTITATGGTAPYSWSLPAGSGVGTLVGPSGSQSAVFTSTAAGSAVVQVTDANGASGTIGITVEAETTTGDDPETGT